MEKLPTLAQKYDFIKDLNPGGKYEVNLVRDKKTANFYALKMQSEEPHCK